MGLIIEPFKFEFSETFSDFLTFIKSLFNLQSSSSGDSSGVCLYPSMTTKDAFSIQFGIIGIFILDFVFMTCFWPRMKAPTLAALNRCTMIWSPLCGLTCFRFQSAAIAAATRAARTVGIKVERKLSNDGVNSDSGKDHDNAGNRLVELQTKTSSEETFILQFAEAAVSSAKSQEIDPSSSDNRGAAALQFFLVVYISPVEVCLKMLTCYRLRGM